MTNEQALKAMKDLMEYTKTNSVFEVQIEEYDSPLNGEGVKLKRAKKVEYLIRTVENVVSPDTVVSQIETIDSQISDLTAKKEEIVQIGDQIKEIV